MSTTIGETVDDALDYFFKEMRNDPPMNEDSESLNSTEFMPNFYHQSVKDAFDAENGRSFGAFMTNHFDTMVQRGPDNVDGSKYTAEVKKFFHNFYYLCWLM